MLLLYNCCDRFARIGVNCSIFEAWDLGSQVLPSSQEQNGIRSNHPRFILSAYQFITVMIWHATLIFQGARDRLSLLRHPRWGYTFLSTRCTGSPNTFQDSIFFQSVGTYIYLKIIDDLLWGPTKADKGLKYTFLLCRETTFLPYIVNAMHNLSLTLIHWEKSGNRHNSFTCTSITGWKQQGDVMWCSSEKVSYIL